MTRTLTASEWEALGSIAAKIGWTGKTLRGWVRRSERDRGLRPGPSSLGSGPDQGAERDVRELAPGCFVAAMPKVFPDKQGIIIKTAMSQHAKHSKA
jgi:hypothetical protein